MKDTDLIPLLIIVGLALAATTTGVVVTYQHFRQRGIRNNNPGNIKRGSSWIGLRPVQEDATFAQFVAPEFGLRALAYLLKRYQTTYGLNTVRGIISRWSSTDQAPYISFVAKELGVSPDSILNVDARLPDLMRAIVEFENGTQPYPSATIVKALEYLQNPASAQLAANAIISSGRYV